MAVELPGRQQVRSFFRDAVDLFRSQRGGLRLYQWVWVVLCLVIGLVVVVPRIFSQPVIYQTTAETRFDSERYAGMYPESGPGYDFHIAVTDATEALRQRSLAQRELRFGSPTYHVAYIPQEPGVIAVRGTGATAAEAKMLADEGAEELVRQVRAAGGREILRNLLGWELVAAMRGEPVSTEFSRHLRNIIEHDAFPMSRPIEPVSDQMDVGRLTRAEKNDLARALEARYNLWTFAINTYNASLDSLCHTANLETTSAREQALRTCATFGTASLHMPESPRQVARMMQETQQRAAVVQAELENRNRAIDRREAIHGALRFMLDEEHATFRPDASGVAYRVAAELPSSPVPRYLFIQLVLTVVISLAFGAVGVAVDRAAGVMSKLRELYRYHELIRDLVVRDLRVRYKGSVLGYVWTQLAPLLMMLVFTFVFTLLMPNGIALFPVFLIVGLLPWNYCSETISGGTRSVLDNANLIKKIFFPREILPLVSVLSSLLNYLLSLPMMFLVMGLTQIVLIGQLNFSWTFLYLPVVILLETLFLIGLTMFLSALAVFFRDIVHLVGILLLFWFFLTPVFYSLDMMTRPSLARLVRWLNPMASIVDFYREILYGSAVEVGKIPTPALPAPDSVLRVVVTVFLMVAFGYWFFQRQSGKFGEVL